MAEFDAEIQSWIFASEGGYVDHPEDPGGATNMGITRRTLAAWRGHPVSKNDVRELSRKEAAKIYKAQYWDTIKGTKLPRGVDYAVYDYGINSGPAQAARDLQRCLGVAVDGVIGVQTLAAAGHADAPSLILCLCKRRWRFMRSLSIFSTFKGGWKRRVWGRKMGVQAEQDIGVADRATMRALGAANNELIPIPAPKPAQGKAAPEAAPAWADPKKIAPIAAAATPVIAGLSGLDGPIMWAIAGVIVVAAGAAAVYAVRRMEDAP